MNNRRKLNNRGLSMVELIISVTILSIIMAGMAGILSAMTRNFSLSQTEITLQNNVQSTYSIVSNLIQEAQHETSKSTEKIVEVVGNRTYIIADNTNSLNKDQASYSIIELDPSTHKLYLYHAGLYDAQADGSYKKVSYPANIKQDNNILATDVTAFSINTDKYDDGYVILGLRCEKRGRTASITENIYLRNSNMSAEWGTTKVKEMESDIPDGYHVLTVKTIENKNDFKYSAGAEVSKDDFTLTGNYVNDNDPTDILLDKKIRKTDIVNIYKGLTDDGNHISLPAGTEIILNMGNANMNAYFLMVDDNGNYYCPSGAKAELKIQAGGSFVNKDTSSGGGITNPEDKNASTNANIEVSSTYDTSSTFTKQLKGTGPDTKSCKYCHKPIKEADGFNEYYQAWVHVENETNAGCPKRWNNLSADDLEIVSGSALQNFTCGKGVITIQNIGSTDAKNIKVVLYVDGGQFVKQSGDFLSFKKSTNSSIGVEYRTTSATSATSAQYVEIKITKLSCYPSDTRKSDLIKINYNWAIPTAAYNNGSRPSLAVFSETHS